jgi:hypothetical protein
MAKVTTAIVYPAIGFMGATNCVPVFGKSVEEVRAFGRTDRARFDLAVEVAAYFYRGVATPQVEDNPAAFRAPWSQVVSL